MCRICHDTEGAGELLSPCECSGTLAPIHRGCLEHWLSASGTSFCELCRYQFAVQRKSRPLLEWLQNTGLRQEKRTLFGDLVCFLLITPLATISGWLCLRGAIDHLHFSSQLEAVGLIALTVALFSIYVFWTLVGVSQVSLSTVQRVVSLQSEGGPPPSQATRGGFGPAAPPRLPAREEAAHRVGGVSAGHFCRSPCRVCRLDTEMEAPLRQLLMALLLHPTLV
ncbi:E3 ubiquitin-protein ligase MARCHF3-like isoform 3-T4 [Odontesthes bonariensis]